MESTRECRIHGPYIYPRWTRCMLCLPSKTEATGDQVIGSEAAAGHEAPRQFDIQDRFSARTADRCEEAIDHPQHYGGDTPTEPIKVIRAWSLGFNLGNAVKYIARAGKKGSLVEDLKKARWYLDDEIKALEGVPERTAT